MSRIIYFSAVFGRPIGGVKTIFRHVEELRRMGLEAYVYSGDTETPRPAWFASDAPILDGQVPSRPDDVLVFPEIGTPYVSANRGLNRRKVLFCQNQDGLFVGLGDEFRTWRDAGVDDAMFCSDFVAEQALRCFSFRHAATVRCAVDRDLFRPLPKKPQVVLMTRKRKDDLPLIRQAFERMWPQYAAIPWFGLKGMTEAEVAARMGASAVFLSLSWREGLGLPPLEAMSCGCLVAGFTGVAGREYARPENGFWVGEDDFFAAAHAIGQALDVALTRPEQAQAMRQAGFATVDHYSAQGMRDDLRAFWTTVLGQ